MRKIKRIISTAILTVGILSLTGCEFMNSKVQSMKGSISGNEYIASFYSNDGEKFMTMHGERIDLSPNTVREYDYVDGGYNKVLSSVVTITIDGKEVENCGSTAIFAEEGLKPDVDFTNKNMFGKSRVVVIQSQLGDPICAYSGDSVFYEVCEDLPKTTKLSVDGKALYIHRANFQIIDTSLLN